MRPTLRTLLVVTMIGLPMDVALADSGSLDGKWGFNLNLLWAKQERKDNAPVFTSGGTEVDSDSTTTTTWTNYSLGVSRFVQNFCFGLRYMNNETKFENENSVGGNSQTTTTSGVWNGLGITLGFMYGGFFSTFNYFVKNSYTINYDDGDDATKYIYDGGTAYALELGYGFTAGDFRIGPQINLIHFDYQDLTIDGEKESLDYDMSDDQIMPQIALWYLL